MYIHQHVSISYIFLGNYILTLGPTNTLKQ